MHFDPGFIDLGVYTKNRCMRLLYSRKFQNRKLGYQFRLYKSRNKHNVSNLSFKDFERTLITSSSNIECYVEKEKVLNISLCVR